MTEQTGALQQRRDRLAQAKGLCPTCRGTQVCRSGCVTNQGWHSCCDCKDGQVFLLPDMVREKCPCLVGIDDVEYHNLICDACWDEAEPNPTDPYNHSPSCASCRGTGWVGVQDTWTWWKALKSILGSRLDLHWNYPYHDDPGSETPLGFYVEHADHFKYYPDTAEGILDALEDVLRHEG